MRLNAKKLPLNKPYLSTASKAYSEQDGVYRQYPGNNGAIVY
jgi:hypothetical protein